MTPAKIKPMDGSEETYDRTAKSRRKERENSRKNLEPDLFGCSFRIFAFGMHEYNCAGAVSFCSTGERTGFFAASFTRGNRIDGGCTDR